MKKVKFIMIVVMLLQMSLLSFAQNETVRVPGIDYSDYVSKILPNIKRPFIILFGSNNCQYSRNQMKLMNLTYRNTDYKKHIDFYSVNADTDENYEWLRTIFEKEEGETLCVPAWVFYRGTKSEEGADYYWRECTNLSQDELNEEIEDLIEEFEDSNTSDSDLNF